MTNRFRKLGNIHLRSGARMLAVVTVLLSACAPMDERMDQGPVFYPDAPDIPRLQYLMTINNEKDIGGESDDFKNFLLGLDQATAGFTRAFAVAHEKGKLYVIDARLSIVVIVDLVKRKFDFIRDRAGGDMQGPMGIFITEDGYKYVADRDRGQIMVYNERDEFHRAYGTREQFKPLGVAVYGNRIYVDDVRDHEVEILDKETGEVIDKIGEGGKDEGQFHWPTHVTVDKEGNVYVTDFLNFRVQIFDKDGNFVKTIGELGNFPGAMPRPKGIAVDREGYLYVVDAAFENIQIFDTRTSDVLMAFGKFNETPAGSWLPAGIHIDYDNLEYFSDLIDERMKAKYLVYVANQAGPSKINVYAFGDWTGPPPTVTKTPEKDEKRPAGETIPSLQDTAPAPKGAKPPAKGGG